MAEVLRRGMPSTEHVRQSLGYHLHTAAINWYDPETGEAVTRTLAEVITGIIIRPATTTLRDVPILDLREDETNKPFVTWFKRIALKGRQEAYGGAHEAVSYWELNAKLGESSIFEYDKLSDWLTGFLRQSQDGLDVYFYHYTTDPVSVSRGDVIAEMQILDWTELDRADIAEARGDSGWIIVNFTLRVWHEGMEDMG